MNRLSRQFKLVGVTGTNGKTTTATMLYQMARAMGYKAGLVSTICNYVNDRPVEAKYTTPTAPMLHDLLQQMAKEGCEYVFMECSSHGIKERRIGGLHFAAGIFTNLTRDHLDYHGTFEDYRDVKKSFFDGLTQDAFAIVNVDDPHGALMVSDCKAQVMTISQKGSADIQGRVLSESLKGMHIEIDGQELDVNLVGPFNLSNLLGIYGAAMALGLPKGDVLRALSTLPPVNGRFEAIQSPGGFFAIVDYAHTPDALNNVLKSIHDVIGNQGRVITVCGAGGNRDKGKRPLMAQEAVVGSDYVILTSDNPRNEAPADIIRDMQAGLTADQLTHTQVIIDRREAIRAAVAMAQVGDVILVAGKGHETYQEINGVRHHFDDHEEIRAAFSNNHKQTI